MWTLLVRRATHTATEHERTVIGASRRLALECSMRPNRGRTLVGVAE